MPRRSLRAARDTPELVGSQGSVINLHQGECFGEQSGYGSLNLMACTSIINEYQKSPFQFQEE